MNGDFLFGFFENVYNYIYMLAEVDSLFSSVFFGFDYLYSALTYLIISAFTFIAVYVLMGIGIYKLSVNNGVSTPVLGFVPFARYYQLGKLVNNWRIMGMNGKTLGILVASLSAGYFVFSNVYGYIYYFAPLMQAFETNNVISVATESGSGYLLNVPYYLNMMFRLAYVVSSVMLTITVFRAYERRLFVLYSLLGVFFGITGIFIFVIRNHKKIDRAAEVARRFAGFAGYNNYGNGHRGDEGGYNAYYDGLHDYSSNSNNKPEQSQKPENDDVFEEYADKKPDNNRIAPDDGFRSNEAEKRDNNDDKYDPDDLFN